jgi:hypothetical protein
MILMVGVTPRKNRMVVAAPVPRMTGVPRSPTLQRMRDGARDLRRIEKIADSRKQPETERTISAQSSRAALLKDGVALLSRLIDGVVCRFVVLQNGGPA